MIEGVSSEQLVTVEPAALSAAVSNAVAGHRGEPGPLLAVLQDVQAELGWVPPQAVPLVAAELNLSRADVHGVLSFYHDFRDAPPARRTVRICRAEACQSMGARDLVQHATDRLGVGLGEVTAGNEIALQQVFCLGNCALGPSVEADGRLYGRVDAARLDAILGEEARA